MQRSGFSLRFGIGPSSESQGPTRVDFRLELLSGSLETDVLKDSIAVDSQGTGDEPVLQGH